MNSIYLIQDGLRREFPNLNTFLTMGYDLDKISVVKENDLEQIPIGLPIPTL